MLLTASQLTHFSSKGREMATCVASIHSPSPSWSHNLHRPHQTPALHGPSSSFLQVRPSSRCQWPLNAALALRSHPPMRFVTRADAESATTAVPETEEEEEEEEAARPSRFPEEEEEEEDQEYVRQILRVLDLLKEKRDMPLNEVRLTIAMEDPIEEDQREEYGIESERGCSREDMAAALVDVYEGRMPADRLVLQELAKEMISWPNLEEEAEMSSNPAVSPYARTTNTGVDPRIVAQKAKLDWDAASEIQPGEDADDVTVPPVVGFSALYLVSAIPILIGVGVVAILYFNSFR